MYWWYLLIVIFSIAYFGYRYYFNKSVRKRSKNPRCSSCGSIMELQTKQGDSEVWVCPKCSDNSKD